MSANIRARKLKFYTHLCVVKYSIVSGMKSFTAMGRLRDAAPFKCKFGTTLTSGTLLELEC